MIIEDRPNVAHQAPAKARAERARRTVACMRVLGAHIFVLYGGFEQVQLDYAQAFYSPLINPPQLIRKA